MIHRPRFVWIFSFNSTQTCQGIEIFKGEIFTFDKFPKGAANMVGWRRKFSFLDPLKYLFLLCNFLNKVFTSFFFPFFGEWLSYNVSQDHLQHHGYMIRLWCIFYSKNKTLLTWSSWSRLYSSLNFLEKTKLFYISFYTGKIRWTFWPVLVSMVSQPSFFITW